jgi:hypothetical protein
VPLGKQIIGVRRKKLQQLTIFGHDWQIHDALRQHPTVYSLREVDGAILNETTSSPTGRRRLRDITRAAA